MSNGYIFEGEIDDDENTNDKVNDIYNHTYKLLVTITPRNIFIKFSPIYMAIALIEISREEKIDKNRMNIECFGRLLVMYDIEYDDYINCYKQIKALLIKDNGITKIKNLKIGVNAMQTPQKRKKTIKLKALIIVKVIKVAKKMGIIKQLMKHKNHYLK